MKKFLIILSLMIGITMAFVPAVAQETMTVYDGEATSSHVPVFGLYADAYTKCQMIMPASELSDLIDGTISKLTWYLASPAAAAWGGNFQIYISEVSQATCPSVDFLDISGATLVYEGPLDGTGETMEIVFTQGYTYGGGNLLISVYETETGSWKAATFSGTTVTGASVSGYSYSGFEYVLASYRDFLPKTTFTYAPLGGVVYHKPKHLAASDITTNSATITWDAGDDETSWGVEYKKAADEEWTSAGTVTEKTIALDALANGVKYDVRVKSIYANGESGWVQISFSTFA
ncbi:MAG: fibronectin type III domain-containing protein, partial [Muribaculaceae bacterium]|nr:fibronectin type III domain-containing protein [Muribaculaceae bacterium]